MPAMKSSEWASLANEIGASFDDEGGDQMSANAAMRLLQEGKRSMQALMSQVDSALQAAEAMKAPPPMPDFDVSAVAEAVRGNQANFDALIKAVQSLKLQVNQAAPNITMPKIDIPTPVVNVEIPRPKGWKFEFVRGKDGLVESIRAIPE
jgi:hypothetical protein